MNMQPFSNSLAVKFSGKPFIPNTCVGVSTVLQFPESTFAERAFVVEDV
jgi:hypothetical protein